MQFTAGGKNVAVAQPFQFQLSGRAVGRSLSIHEPISTIVAARKWHGIVQPFLVKYHGGTDPGRNGEERSHSVDVPLLAAIY